MFTYEEFKSDPQFVGRWKSPGKCYTQPPTDKKEIIGVAKTFAKKEANAKANPKTGRNAFRPSSLILGKQSPPKQGEAFWSEDKLIDNVRGEALEMKVRTVEGKQYLLVEIGLFPDEPSKDWQCGHLLYPREH